MSKDAKRRIGVVGFGRLGEHLVGHILQDDKLQLAFVWNRTPSVLDGKVSAEYVLRDLGLFAQRNCHLVVEVAHPCVAQRYGQQFLRHADFMIGSPSALADPDLESGLRAAADVHGLYVPSGAFWGAEDVAKMADRGTLSGLMVTMTKSPRSLKLIGELKEKNDTVTDGPVVLYDGPVRGLCSLAPNNVNTMAVGAIVARNLGFDRVRGRLIADPGMADHHSVEIEVVGGGAEGSRFECKTVRLNPSERGAVTGSATLHSFVSSMLGARGKGPGVHSC